MSSGFIANQYELLNSVILKHSGGEVDITDAILAMSITEDISYSDIQCSMAVVDSSGSLDTVEFDGTERFKYTFQSTQEDDAVISLEFRIYKVDITIDTESNNIKTYTLNAITPETITQSSMDINQSFKMPLHKTAQHVFDKLGSNKEFNVHETTGQYTYIVPGMTPFETMDFLCRRAYDSRYRSSAFFFYETADGYNFKNLERVIAEERDNAIQYRYTPTASVTDPDPQFVITDINLPTNKDILKKINSGAYANAVREIDLINQRVNSSEVRIKEDFITFEHLDDVAMSLDSKDIIDEHLNTINSTRWINSTGVEDKRRELIPRRKFYMDCLSQVYLSLRVPGNSNLRIGKVLDLDLLEMSGKTEEKGQEPKISGKYLITSLTHSILGGEYVCTITCQKESYRANSDNLERNIVVKQNANG